LDVREVVVVVVVVDALKRSEYEVAVVVDASKYSENPPPARSWTRGRW
jgi:hypothetical protein